jgi:hypothetical protein
MIDILLEHPEWEITKNWKLLKEYIMDAIATRGVRRLPFGLLKL